MSSLAVQNNNLTTQYINSVKAECKCNFKSIIAKISLLVFPLILLVTFVVDLFSKSTSIPAGIPSGSSLKKEVTNLLDDQNTLPSERMGKLFDLVQDRTIGEILSTANEMVQDQPTLIKIMLAVAALQEDQHGMGPVVERAEDAYPALMGTIKALSPQNQAEEQD